MGFLAGLENNHLEVQTVEDFADEQDRTENIF